MSIEAQIYENLEGIAQVERIAAQAHYDWRQHVDSCSKCKSFPKGCATGNRLDELATMWDRRSEGL